MENYERYLKQSRLSVIEDKVSNFLWREPSDKILAPIINKFNGKKVLDIGCGTGYYADMFLKNSNEVIGIDKNPQLCRSKIKVIDEDAANFSHYFGFNAFDVVFSAWLTEYLDQYRIQRLFFEVYTVMKKGGVFVMTNISDKGWGRVYITLSRKVRKIDKYFYPSRFILDNLAQINFTGIEMIRLNSYLNIPWAELYICRK